MLKAAMESVTNLKKSDLDTIKNYNNPPEKVAIAMKPIYCMISNEKKADVKWEDIKKFMMKDVKKEVDSFNADALSVSVKDFVLEKFIDKP